MTRMIRSSFQEDIRTFWDVLWHLPDYIRNHLKPMLRKWPFAHHLAAVPYPKPLWFQPLNLRTAWPSSFGPRISSQSQEWTPSHLLATRARSLSFVWNQTCSLFRRHSQHESSPVPPLHLIFLQREFPPLIPLDPLHSSCCQKTFQRPLLVSCLKHLEPSFLWLLNISFSSEI